MLPGLLEILKPPSTPPSVPQYTPFYLLLSLPIQPVTVPVRSVGELLPFHFNVYACSPGKGLTARRIFYFIKDTE